MGDRKVKSILALMLIVTLTFIAATGSASEVQPNSRLGQDAPAFRLPALKGAAQSLTAMRGKFLVVHFTASW